MKISLFHERIKQTQFLNFIIMKRNMYYILLLLITTALTSCNSDLNDGIELKNNENTLQIPKWAKGQITNEEMKILNKLSKKYKLTFFKATDKDKTEYIQISDIEKSINSIDNKIDNKEIATIIRYPRLKSIGEGSSSSLGRVSAIVHKRSYPTQTITVTAYWGYSYIPGKITSINSFDVDHMTTGFGIQTYFVSQGSTYEISSSGRAIDYIVAGAIRYKATTGGEVGVEVTVTEFQTHGSVGAKVN